MLLKRSLVLAVGILLFLGGFFIYFEVSDAQREARFHQERMKAGAEGTISVSSDPALFSAKNLPAPAPVPAPASGDASDTNATANPATPTDSTTPDSAPSSNAAPAAPSSTMVRPRLNPLLSALIFAAYTPSNGAPVQTQAPTPEPTLKPTPVSTTPTPTPMPFLGGHETGTNVNAAPGAAATNGESSPAPTTNETSTPSPATTNAVEPRAMPVEVSAIVLGYHQFVGPGETSKNIYVMSQDVFEAEMKYIKDNGYHVVPLSDIVRFVKHEIGLPPNSVAITIDDGYKSAIVWAAPVLKKYGYPWTYFVYPDFISVNENKGSASWNDLLALQADGVDIECHSMRHPFLTKHHQEIKKVWYTFTPETYEQFLTLEIVDSKALLEQKLGKPVSYFAYPYGDYNKEVEAKAVAAGYDAIFTVADNPVHSTTDRYSIGRYIITKPVEKAFASYLRQGALSVANADPAPGTTINQARPVITASLDYVGNLDPNSIETDVRDFGTVRHDFDPKTSTIRLYLPRDLIKPVNIVNISVKDASTGQRIVANWQFNYEPAGAAPVHAPIAATAPVTNTAPSENTASSTNTTPSTADIAPTRAPTTAPTPASVSSSKTASSSSSKNPAAATGAR